MRKFLLIWALAASFASGFLHGKEILQEIVVKDGDTLWGIANTYLKDPKKWPEILKYNQLPLNDPTGALPGMKLKVPVQLIKEELRKASIIYIQNDVRYRKKNQPEWIKAAKDSELYNDYGLRTLDESRAHVQFYSGDILKLDQNSLVVLRPELKVEEVNLLAGTLQAGRSKLVTGTARVTPLSKDTLYKARIRIDKALIVQVERGSTEVLGTFTGKKVIVGKDEATIAYTRNGPVDPVKVGKLPGLETVDFDARNRVIVPAGHANITLPDRPPSVPVKVPSLPDFEMVDFDESGKAVIPRVYAHNDKRERSPAIAPVEGSRGGSASPPPAGAGAAAPKKGAAAYKSYRIQFSLDPKFSRPALDKRNPMGSSDPLGENNEYGLPDGIYHRRISYGDEAGKETDFIDLPDLDIDNLPPKLLVLQPAEHSRTRKDFVAIEGQTEPRCFVRINDQQVPIKQDAKFTWSVLLQEGQNKIRFVVTDKKGNVTKLDRTVIKEKTFTSEAEKETP